MAGTAGHHHLDLAAQQGDLLSNGIFAWPDHIQWSNFVRAWNIGNFSTYFRNSLVLIIVKVPLGIVISSLAAYPLAKMDFRFRSGDLYLLSLRSGHPHSCHAYAAAGDDEAAGYRRQPGRSDPALRRLWPSLPDLRHARFLPHGALRAAGGRAPGRRVGVGHLLAHPHAALRPCPGHALHHRRPGHLERTAHRTGADQRVRMAHGAGGPAAVPGPVFLALHGDDGRRGDLHHARLSFSTFSCNATWSPG